MAPHHVCFERATLVQFALGKLPEEELDRIAAEVEACPDCRSLLQTLDELEDSVIRDLRSASPPGVPADESARLEAQMQRAEAIVEQAWNDPGIPTEDPMPRRLGQYDLLERIGQGGMGAVYKAFHNRLKRFVAIKLLPAGRLRDPLAVARFQQEMEAVGRLDHPHLVRAHDAGEAEGQHFLAMEFLEGTDLSRLVKNGGPLHIPDACEAIRQAALGLQHAHEHGLIHRDVKPSNLMLTTDGVVKLLDLGLARVISAGGEAGETTTGQVFGTGDYIAPEQADDTHLADAPSDIYSLGCTLYYLLTGRAPFADKRFNTFTKKILAHRAEPVPDVREARPETPPDLAAIVARMMAKEPHDRFQAAADVAAVLEPFSFGTTLRDLPGRPDIPEETRFARVGRAGARMNLRPLLWLITMALVATCVFHLWRRIEIERVGAEIMTDMPDLRGDLQELKSDLKDVLRDTDNGDGTPRRR